MTPARSRGASVSSARWTRSGSAAGDERRAGRPGTPEEEARRRAVGQEDEVGGETGCGHAGPGREVRGNGRSKSEDLSCITLGIEISRRVERSLVVRSLHPGGRCMVNPANSRSACQRPRRAASDGLVRSAAHRAIRASALHVTGGGHVTLAHPGARPGSAANAFRPLPSSARVFSSDGSPRVGKANTPGGRLPANIPSSRRESKGANRLFPGGRDSAILPAASCCVRSTRRIVEPVPARHFQGERA